MYDALVTEAFGVRKSIQSEENVLVIQPYIKWGPKKSNISVDIKLQESKDLINSLDTWKIVQSIKVPLIGFGKKTFFGRGKTDELRTLIKQFNGDTDRKVSINQMNLRRKKPQFVFVFFFRLVVFL